MTSVIIITFVVFFILAKSHQFDPIAKLILYSYLSYWGIALFLSSINAYDVHPVKPTTYFLLLVNVLSFTLGMCLYKRKDSSPILVESNSNHSIAMLFELLLSNKFYLLFLFVADVFLAYIYSKQQVLLSIYDMSDIRVNVDELLFEGNSFLGLFNNIVISPISPIVLTVSCYALLFKRNKVLPLILSSIYIIISSLNSGSRGGVFRLIVYCVFLYMLRDIFVGKNNHKKQGSPSWLLVLALSVAVIAIMSYMTAQRTYGINDFSWETIQMGFDSLMEQFVTYSIVPFKALDYSFDHNYFEILGGYKYGRCTFGFIDGFISLVLNYLGIPFQSNSSVVIDLLQNNWIDCGGSHTHNFAYSAVFMFYQDFGVLGVLIFPFIFGYTIMVFISKFRDCYNPFILVLLANFFYIALYSTFTWGMYRHTQFFTFLYLYIGYKWFENRRNRALC